MRFNTRLLEHSRTLFNHVNPILLREKKSKLIIIPAVRLQIALLHNSTSTNNAKINGLGSVQLLVV